MTTTSTDRTHLHGTHARWEMGAGTRPPVVLAAVGPSSESVTALVRADEMARLLGGTLRLVQPVPEDYLAWAGRRVARCVTSLPSLLDEAAERLRAWAELTLRMPIDRADVAVRVGETVEAVSVVAEECDAALVVVSAPRLERCGLGERNWSTVARKLRRPVLVARLQRKGREVIAATDFSDARLPTLFRADALARDLSSKLTLLHNIAPGRQGVAGILGYTLPDHVARRFVARRQSRLVSVLRELGRERGNDGDVVIMRYRDPVQSILRTARRRDADLVVVGTHAPRRGRRAVMHTADRVLLMARRSVLVVPMEPFVASLD